MIQPKQVVDGRTSTKKVPASQDPELGIRSFGLPVEEMAFSSSDIGRRGLGEGILVMGY